MTRSWGEEIISSKPRWKRVFVCIFLSFGLFMLLCVSPGPTQYIFHTRYSLCAEHQTNKQTIVKEGMLYPAFVCLYVCLFVFLFVCLLTISHTDRIIVIISPETYLWTSKSLLNFGSNPDLDPDLGIFEGIFTIPGETYIDAASGLYVLQTCKGDCQTILNDWVTVENISTDILIFTDEVKGKR